MNVLDGGAGDDAIDGGAGDDVLTGNLGSDTIEGGAGADIAVFAGNLENYTFASSADGLTVTVTDTETGDADTITGVETLRFDDADIGVSLNTTDNRMVLTGTSAADTITVVGDVGIEIPGTDGADILNGDLGDDVFEGGADADDIAGGAGDDTIDGDAGDDILAGDAGDDTIDGGAGTDIAVFAGNQLDYTFESSADGQTITITHVSTSDVDTVTNVETLRFDDGDIGVSADANGLVLTGSAGVDNITIVGSVAVTVLGQDDADILTGSTGNDIIEGGAGDDVIAGGAGDDLLTGDAGDDTIVGGAGADTAVFDGNRADFSISVSAGVLTVTDLRTGTPEGIDDISGVETLQFNDEDFAVTTDANGAVTITGSDSGDVIRIVGEGDVTVEGGAGNDTIYGGDGADQITGGDGADTIDGGLGADVIDAGAGNDVIVDNIGMDTYDGGAGVDEVQFAGDQGSYTFTLNSDGSLNVLHTDLSSADYSNTDLDFSQPGAPTPMNEGPVADR